MDCGDSFLKLSVWSGSLLCFAWMCVHYDCCRVELLKNALRATMDQVGVLKSHEAPPVRIAVRQDATHLYLTVTDQGVGMSDAAQANLFSFFFSTAPPPLLTYTYSRQFGAPFTGLGMGLGSVQAYTQLYAGEVVVQTRVGHGTAVQLRLARKGDWEL